MSRPHPDVPADQLAVVPLDALLAATKVLAELPYKHVAPIARPLEQIHTLDEFHLAPAETKDS